MVNSLFFMSSCHGGTYRLGIIGWVSENQKAVGMRVCAGETGGGELPFVGVELPFVGVFEFSRDRFAHSGERFLLPELVCVVVVVVVTGLLAAEVEDCCSLGSIVCSCLDMSSPLVVTGDDDGELSPYLLETVLLVSFVEVNLPLRLPLRVVDSSDIAPHRC